MDTGTNLTPSNTMDNSIGQVVPFNDPYQEPTDLITAQAGGGQEGQKTPDDVFSADAEHFDDVAPLDGPCLHCGNDMFTEAHKSWFCDRESGGCGIVAHFVNPFEAESFATESKRCSYCKTENLEDFAKGWDDYCMKCAKRHHREYGADSKFKRPYDGRHGFNPKRDTKGRFRRKLVVPLAKGAESFAVEWDEDGYAEKQAVYLRRLVEDAMRNGCWTKEESMEIMDEASGLGMSIVESHYFHDREAESLVEEPDWIPAGDGRALGQQNLDINLSPLHAEGNLKDYNPITLVVLGIIGGIGVALGAQSLVK